LRKSRIDFLCAGEFINSAPLIRIKLVVFPNKLLLTELSMRLASGDKFPRGPPGETLVLT
jgi:hypothetical protein